ncbi:chalcone isomerase family protein [Acidovorax sp. IB03]|uniref:chalcone isomerase family protein n=1 Tax=Acidovorax sp. IB03 TaxID=2779366 RepID=UPI0018E906CD|nr:chalcone isomerase family protein [Acidovorax sp. IB03]MBJ2163388.1 chalcone isomerase family protein [Acidovorax sp. IB03]
MKKIAACALLAGATAIFYINPASAQGSDATPLPGTVLAGQGTMRFFGLEVYQARLWVSPGFAPERYADQPLALALTYQRNFTAQAIAKRSIEEMRRVAPFGPEQAERWQAALQAALPDVKPGDTLTGIYRPGGGAVFRMADKVVGEVADPEFARLFFGIWLSPNTSEPALRQALLASRSPAGSP